jgi:myo-inositol-1(or 4)-monophosphatase
MNLDEQLVDAALAAAREAAALHRSEAGRLDPSGWSEKGTADFVTEVDREAERGIIRSLAARFPEHVFLAEEGTQVEEGTHAEAGPKADEGPKGHLAPIRWIIDPLDGTTNWLHDYPEYAVSIAAFDDEGLRVGVVVNSATGDEFDAGRGRGSRRNGDPIHTSELRDIRLGLIGTGFPFKRREFLPRYLRSLGEVLARSSGVRRAGAAALDLCALAMGRLDAFWEFWLMPWDVAAGALILQEAGGVFESLHIPDDPLVRAAGEEGALFVRACSGDVGGLFTGSGGLGGGAFIAANPYLLPDLRQILGAERPRPER